MFRKKKNNLSQNGPGKGKRPMGGGSVALNGDTDWIFPASQKI